MILWSAPLRFHHSAPWGASRNPNERTALPHASTVTQPSLIRSHRSVLPVLRFTKPSEAVPAQFPERAFAFPSSTTSFLALVCENENRSQGLRAGIFSLSPASGARSRRAGRADGRGGFSARGSGECPSTSTASTAQIVMVGDGRGDGTVTPVSVIFCGSVGLVSQQMMWALMLWRCVFFCRF